MPMFYMPNVLTVPGGGTPTTVSYDALPEDFRALQRGKNKGYKIEHSCGHPLSFWENELDVPESTFNCLMCLKDWHVKDQAKWIQDKKLFRVTLDQYEFFVHKMEWVVENGVSFSRLRDATPQEIRQYNVDCLEHMRKKARQ